MGIRQVLSANHEKVKLFFRKKSVNISKEQKRELGALFISLVINGLILNYVSWVFLSFEFTVKSLVAFSLLFYILSAVIPELLDKFKTSYE